MKYILRCYFVVQLLALNTDQAITFMVAIATTCTVRIHGKSRSEAILIPVAFITTSGGNIIFLGPYYHAPLVAISFSVALVTTAGGNIIFCGPYLPPPVAISSLFTTAGGNIISVALVTTASGNIIFCGPYYHRRWQYHFCGF